MGKALKEARARLSALEATVKAKRDDYAAAKAARAPLEAKVTAIRKRLARVQVIKYLAGSYYVGTLDMSIEVSYGAADVSLPGAKAAMTPKKLREALEVGGAKIKAGGYGQSYSLKGLLPRIRLLDKPTFKVYQRAVAARKRAEAALAKAQGVEAAAFKVTYNTGAKPDREALIDGLVAKAIAELRLSSTPHPAQLEHEINRLIDGQFGAITLAKAHLAHVKAGEDGPCSICERDAQQAAVRKAELDRRATLPTLMLVCPTHGRKRMRWEKVNRTLTQDEFTALDLASYGMTWDYWRNRFDLPAAYCPGGDVIVVKAELERDAKAAKKAAAKAAKPRKVKLAGPGDTASVGDQVTFTCPSCGDVATSEVYLDDGDEDDGTEPQLRVGCDRCETEPLVGAVIVHQAPKAA